MEDREEAAGSKHYGKPPWRFKGRAVYQLHLVKSRVARALIPKDLRLVQAFGYTLGGFFLANYDDSPVGAFDELVVIAGIVWNPPTSCAWASKVLVNSDEACLHGRTDVGLPSHVARFTKLQCCRKQFSRSTAKTGQQESRAKLFLSKIGLQRTKPPSVKYDLKTNVTELYGGVSAEDIFSISLLSSLPADNSKAFLGPHIKMSLPSFSGRTQYHASLLKYSCQMECRVRIVHPLQISSLSPTDNIHQAVEDECSSAVNKPVEETTANRSTSSLAVMLSKPILAFEFNCLTMNVEAPKVIAE